MVSASRAREKIPVREEIVSVAETLFFSRGYEGVSMGDVARRTGLYPATVRLYFKNKEELYLAIVLRGMGALNAVYERRCEPEVAGLEKLWALGEALIEFSRRYPDYYRLLYCSEPGATISLHEDNLRRVYDAIEACMRGGSVRCDLEPPVLVLFLIALYLGVFSLDPCWRLALEAEGISHERFSAEFPRYAADVSTLHRKRVAAATPGSQHRCRPGSRS